MSDRQKFIESYRSISGGDDEFAGEVYDILTDPDPTRLWHGLAEVCDDVLSKPRNPRPLLDKPKKTCAQCGQTAVVNRDGRCAMCAWLNRASQDNKGRYGKG